MDVSDEKLDELYRAGFAVALRLLGDVGDAEDCAQEATARAVDRWAQVREYAVPWVVRTSANLAIGLLRKRRRIVVGLPGAWTGVDSASEPEELVARLDVRAKLLALPRRQRQALVLRYLADLSEQDAARAMGVGAGSVKTHTRRGLSRLRTSLDDGGDR